MFRFAGFVEMRIEVNGPNVAVTVAADVILRDCGVEGPLSAPLNAVNA
jgi:hypothetical protein